jgi:hypothetical protein
MMHGADVIGHDEGRSLDLALAIRDSIHDYIDTK